MTTAQPNPSPAQRLGQRLMPGQFDFLVFTLAGFWYLLAKWAGSPWLMVAASTVALIAGGLGQFLRHRRDEIIRDHVPYLAFRRPRAVDAIVEAPSHRMDPAITEAPLRWTVSVSFQP